MKLLTKIVGLVPILVFLVSSLAAALAQTAPAQKPNVLAQKKTIQKKTKPPEPARPTANFAPIDALVQEKMDDQSVTGAVLAVGHDGRIVHQKAFGFRATTPRLEPMTVDTVFDLASLTKVVATTPSVMRLVQYGQVRLDEPVAHYIPDFGMNGKDTVTVRQLLTHYSGLRPDLDLTTPWEGQETAFRLAHEEKLQSPQGSQFVYSDINFTVLGEVVQRVSGMSLDKFAEIHIFQPLGMKHTRFLPPPEWRGKIAETLSIDHQRNLRGHVQDPTAGRMGGVAGHAGVFSTAGDLAPYAQAPIHPQTNLSSANIGKIT